MFFKATSDLYRAIAGRGVASICILLGLSAGIAALLVCGLLLQGENLLARVGIEAQWTPRGPAVALTSYQPGHVALFRRERCRPITEFSI